MRLRRGLLAVALGAWGASHATASDWVEFTNETASRISAPPNLVVSDPEEKEYAFGDVDKDGDIDLVIMRKQPFTSTGKKPNVLLMNENGVLTDRTALYASAADDGGQGFLTPTNDRDSQLADFNNDGWLDIITATTLTDNQAKTLSHPRVYINLGEDGAGNWLGFKYEEARIPQMHPNAGPRFCSVGVVDADDDGYMDLYFGDYDSGGAMIFDYNNKLLMNRGAEQPGFFDDETNARLTTEMKTAAFGASSFVADINKDGAMDVVKQTSLNSPLHIAVTYNNPANKGVFKSYDVIDNGAPYFVNGGDLNNDGWVDLIVVDDGSDKFYLNQANPGFNGPGEVGWKMAQFSNSGGFGGDAYAVDLNNDTWLDVLITDVDVDIPNCGGSFDLHRNNGNAPNVTFTHDMGNLPAATLHDVAVFDIDGDGWLDMVQGRCNQTSVQMNQPPIGIAFSYPVGFPGQVPPQTAHQFEIVATPEGGNVVPGSAELFVAVNGGEFTNYGLTHLEDNRFSATLPEADCASSLEWYVSVSLDTGFTFTSPGGAPNQTFATEVSYGTQTMLHDPIEHLNDIAGWTVSSDANLTSGAWEAVVPIGSIAPPNKQAAPDKDGSAPSHFVKAFVTQNGQAGDAANLADVDGGFTTLTSPVFDLDGTDAFVTFSYWLFSEIGQPDLLLVEITNDGRTWITVASLGNSNSAWSDFTFRAGDFVEPSANMQVRFTIGDPDNLSITEAGIDDLIISSFICDIGIVSSNPPTESIDARQPSNIDGSGATGILTVELTFASAAAQLGANDFSISEEGGDRVAPAISGLILTDDNEVTMILDEPIEVGAWTTITHIASGSTVRLGYLPGDVNGDGTTTVPDVLALIDALNGVSTLSIWSTDIDRSGVASASDVLRAIDLLNGAGAFDSYLNASLPE